MITISDIKNAIHSGNEVFYFRVENKKVFDCKFTTRDFVSKEQNLKKIAKKHGVGYFFKVILIDCNDIFKTLNNIERVLNEAES